MEIDVPAAALLKARGAPRSGRAEAAQRESGANLWTGLETISSWPGHGRHPRSDRPDFEPRPSARFPMVPARRACQFMQ